MEQIIPITNKTMELAECKDAWFFDEKYSCWCLEDILYTEKATTPKFQRLSIYVPEAFMKDGGQINEEAELNGFTAKTVPVIFENNSAGYMQMPHIWLESPGSTVMQYVSHGFVYVTAGNRGHESKDAEGKFVGRAPINLIDLKTAIRFLRHNRACIPGDMDKMISVGCSAGGAMSTLLAVTGDHPNYDAYLREAGAFMDESDHVYASQCYCPVTDLEHADLGYEWCFGADKENQQSPAGPAGVMGPFEEALSKELSKSYIDYVNGLALRDEKGNAFTIGADGRSGVMYDRLLEELSKSATKYLKKLEDGSLGKDYSAEDYILGNYSYEKDAPMGPGGPGGPGGPEGPGGPGGPDEDLGLGEMLCRPPKGVPVMVPSFPKITVQGENKEAWLSWNGSEAKITDLDTYVLHHRRRMKPCPSFDVKTCSSGENKVYGNENIRARHFSKEVAVAIEKLKEDYPQEYDAFGKDYAEAMQNEELACRVYLNNPFNYIGSEEAKQAKQAEHVRIRLGASDADTALNAGLLLSMKLKNAGIDTDYALVWDEPHGQADYAGEILTWVDSICK